MAAGGNTRRAGSNDSPSAQQEQTPSVYPYSNLRFWVSIDHVEIASFQECTGLAVETQVEEVIEGGLNTYVHKLPVRTKYSNITLKRGIDEGQDLYSWYMLTQKGLIKRQTMSIIVYDAYQIPKNPGGQTGNTLQTKERREVRRWDIQLAYPVKWTGPNLSAEHGAVLVETVEIAHGGIISRAAAEELRNGTKTR